MKKYQMIKFYISRIYKNIYRFIRWGIFSAIVGIVVGSFSTLFAYCLRVVTEIRTGHPQIIFALPLGGIVIVALYGIFKYKNDKGTNLVLSTIHAETEIPFRMAPLIFISTIITHFLGGSAGREGAALQLGGSIGNQLGRLFRFDEKDRRIVVMCGMSAAFSARGNKNAVYSDVPQQPDPNDKKYLNADGSFNQTLYDTDYGKYKDKVELYNNTIGNSILTQAEAQFDLLINGVVTMLNDVFCPNLKDKNDDDRITIKSAVEGTTKDANGNDITFKLDTSKKYKLLDVTNSPVGADDDETIGTELFVRTGMSRYTKITLDHQVYSDSCVDSDGNPLGLAKDNGDGTYTLYVYNEENVSIEQDKTDGKYTYNYHDDKDGYTDKTTMYTITNLQINPDILADYSLLPVKENSTGGDSGAYAQDIYQKILTAWKSDFAVLDPNTKTSYTFDEYYNEMIGNFGTRGSVWQTIVDNQEKEVQQDEEKRQQIAGVSTDEELASLLTYQHAYNAASRYINVVNQMLEHLLERLG